MKACQYSPEKDDSDSFDFETKIRFTSDTDVVGAPVKFSLVNAKALRGYELHSYSKGDDFTLDTFPLTVKTIQRMEGIKLHTYTSHAVL